MIGNIIREKKIANNSSLHNATLDIERELNLQEKINNKIKDKSKYHDQDISVESSISQIFGNKEPGQIEMKGEAQETLCLLLNINPIPGSILKQFKRARWIR